MITLNLIRGHAAISLSPYAQSVATTVLKMAAVALGVFALYQRSLVQAGVAIGMLALAVWVNRGTPADPEVPVDTQTMLQVRGDVGGGDLGEGAKDPVREGSVVGEEIQVAPAVGSIPVAPPVSAEITGALPVGNIPPAPPISMAPPPEKKPYRDPSAAGVQRESQSSKRAAIDFKAIAGGRLTLRSTRTNRAEEQKQGTPEGVRAARARENRRSRQVKASDAAALLGGENAPVAAAPALAESRSRRGSAAFKTPARSKTPEANGSDNRGTSLLVQEMKKRREALRTPEEDEEFASVRALDLVLSSPRAAPGPAAVPAPGREGHLRRGWDPKSWDLRWQRGKLRKVASEAESLEPSPPGPGTSTPEKGNFAARQLALMLTGKNGDS